MNTSVSPEEESDTSAPALESFVLSATSIPVMIRSALTILRQMRVLGAITFRHENGEEIYVRDDDGDFTAVNRWLANQTYLEDGLAMLERIHINDHSDNWNYVEFNRNGTVNTNDASQLSTHDFDFSAADFTFVNTSVSPEEESDTSAPALESFVLSATHTSDDTIRIDYSAMMRVALGAQFSHLGMRMVKRSTHATTTVISRL